MPKYALSVNDMEGKTIDPMHITEKAGIKELRAFCIKAFSNKAVTVDVWTLGSKQYGRHGRKYTFGTPIGRMEILSVGGYYFWQSAGSDYMYRVRKTTGQLYDKMKAKRRWY